MVVNGISLLCLDAFVSLIQAADTSWKPVVVRGFSIYGYVAVKARAGVLEHSLARLVDRRISDPLTHLTL